MAKIKEALHNMHKAIMDFIAFMVGREEDTEEEKALPTQRNQYFN